MSSPNDITPLGGDLPVTGAFLLEVDGVEIGVFREVFGLQVTVAVEEIREGGQNGFVRKVPGRMSWPNIVFRRGLTQSDALFDWMSKSSGEGFAKGGNKVDRLTGAITAISRAGIRLRAWELYDVMPVRWQGPEFSVDRQAPLEEELEIVHHGFKAMTS